MDGHSGIRDERPTNGDTRNASRQAPIGVHSPSSMRHAFKRARLDDYDARPSSKPADAVFQHPFNMPVPEQFEAELLARSRLKANITRSVSPSADRGPRLFDKQHLDTLAVKDLLREQTDASSSHSGRTSSNVSASDIRKCHVCKVQADADMLIKCASCSRRYHRHCHSTKRVPSIVGTEWQCQRCERKKVPLKRTAPEEEGNVGPSFTTRDCYPTACTRHVDQSDGRIVETEGTVNKADKSRLKKASDLTIFDSIAATLGGNDDAAQPEKPAHATDIDSAAANELVEKSFAMIDKSTWATGPMRARKSMIVKRKLGDDNRDNSFSAAGTGDERHIDIAKGGRSEHNFATANSYCKDKMVEPTMLYPGRSNNEKVIKSIPKTSLLGDPLEVQNGGPNAENSETNGLTPHHKDPSVSPADSAVVQKIKRSSAQRIVECSKCHSQKAPWHPSGKALCRHCKAEASNARASSTASASGTYRAGKECLPLPGPSNPASNTKQRMGEASNPALATTTVDHDDAPDQLLSSISRLQGDDPHENFPPSHPATIVPDAVPTSSPVLRSESDNQLVVPENDTPSPSNSRKKGGSTRGSSCRGVPIDEYDLGTSRSRPPGTYWRLIAMALCDAPNNCLQPVSVVKWIVENIPRYSLLPDKAWAENLKATMILNNNGKSGKKIVSRTPWKNGDGGEGTGDWYKLLPGLNDELEHWDRTLQRPVLPRSSAPIATGPAIQPVVEKGKVPRSTATEVDDVADQSVPSDEGICAPKQTQQPRGSKAATSRQAPTNTMVEVDHATVNERSESPDHDHQALKQGLPHCASKTVDSNPPHAHVPIVPNTEAAPASPKSSGDSNFAGQNRSFFRTTEHDDVYFRALIREEIKKSSCCDKTLLEAWPDFHPSNSFDVDSKSREIMARPNRKHIRHRPPVHGLERKEVEQPKKPNLFVVDETLSDDEGVDSHTNHTKCKSLEEFLGVSVDLIPVMHEQKLAFRHPDSRSRVVYKTGI